MEGERKKARKVIKNKFSFWKTFLPIFLIVLSAILMGFGSLDELEETFIEAFEASLILAFFLAIVFTLLIKWRKDYKSTGKWLVFSYKNDNLKTEMKKQIKPILKTIFFVSIALTITMFWYNQYTFYFTDEHYGSIRCPAFSNVAVIKIQGKIVTYGMELVDSEDSERISSDIVSSERIIQYINQTKKDDDIKAVIVEIDSSGGSPVASEEIADALKSIGKPTVAVIRQIGASGAYFIATGADRIYASEISDIGGIGVTASYLDYSQKNKEEGLIYQQLSVGKFKNTGDPDKELTAEEKELLMRDIKKSHRFFIESVAKNRGLDVEVVEKLADGSTMLGRDAKENGLIDEIGNMDDVKGWLRNNLKIEPEVCVY